MFTMVKNNEIIHNLYYIILKLDIFFEYKRQAFQKIYKRITIVKQNYDSE